MACWDRRSLMDRWLLYLGRLKEPSRMLGGWGEQWVGDRVLDRERGTIEKLDGRGGPGLSLAVLLDATHLLRPLGK